MRTNALIFYIQVIQASPLSQKQNKCLLSKKKNEEVCSSGSEKFQYLFVFAAKSEEKITVSTQDMLANKQR